MGNSATNGTLKVSGFVGFVAIVATALCLWHLASRPSLGEHIANVCARDCGANDACYTECMR